MDPLFPELPDLAELGDEELDSLYAEHEVAVDLIEKEDDDFTKGLSGEEIIAQLESGVAQMQSIRDEQKRRADEQEAYLARKAELLAGARGEELSDEAEEAAEGEESEDAEATEDAGEELAAEESEESEDAEAEAEADAEDKDDEEPVVASRSSRRAVRRPPSPSRERARQERQHGAPLIAASGHQDVRGGQVLTRRELASAMKVTAQRRGAPSKSKQGVEEKIMIASATFDFPEERRLYGDIDDIAEKIRAVVPASVPGAFGSSLDSEAMVASGGLCAPLTPIYTLVNFASQARPVRDALPSFNADRGGVNVPTSTTIGDITSAITVIEESEDALGGTFATKSCQDLECPAYTETAITIISHCREYGNLNAMAWPEKIAHENDLTMAAHARTAESYLLDRIKALSINVTNGAETLGALIYLVDAIVKASFGIRGRLRMDPNARFRALIPWWVPEMLTLDTVQSVDGNRFKSTQEIITYLRSYKIEPSFYLDSPTTGTTQLPDSAQTAAAIDALPDNVQWALFPEGAFIHLDSGSLELGIVRDSTLNSTNDFQLFGENFENVARLAPEQSCYWITSDLCANGMLAPAGTARTCD